MAQPWVYDELPKNILLPLSEDEDLLYMEGPFSRALLRILTSNKLLDVSYGSKGEWAFYSMWDVPKSCLIKHTKKLCFVNSNQIPSGCTPLSDQWLTKVQHIVFERLGGFQTVLSWPWQNLKSVQLRIMDSKDLDKVNWPKTLRELSFRGFDIQELVLSGLPDGLECLTISMTFTVGTERDTLILFNQRVPTGLRRIGSPSACNVIFQGVPGETFEGIEWAINVTFKDEKGAFYPPNLKLLALWKLWKGWTNKEVDFVTPERLEVFQLQLQNLNTTLGPGERAHFARLIQGSKKLTQLSLRDRWGLKANLPDLPSLQHLSIQEHSEGPEIKGFPESIRSLIVGVHEEVKQIVLPPNLELAQIEFFLTCGPCKVLVPESCRFLFVRVHAGSCRQDWKKLDLQVSRAPKYSSLKVFWQEVGFSLKENLIQFPQVLTREEPQGDLWQTKDCPKTGSELDAEIIPWLIQCYA